jgi:hypothetical protein
MTSIPISPHDLQPISVGVTLVAALCAFYWRLALRLAATAVIALIILGAILLIEMLQHVVS